MKNISRLVFSFVLLVVVAAATGLSMLEHAYKTSARELCDLVDENYFKRESSEARQFVEWCRQASAQQSFLYSKAANIKRMNNRLSLIRTSHLAVYNPDENRMMWENRGLDTGIRSHLVEAHLVIFKIVPLSPAARAGLKVGDEIVRIRASDSSVVSDTPSVAEAQALGGSIEINRAGTPMSFVVGTEVVSEDLSPTLTAALETLARVGVLKIPSFLSNYFAAESWLALAGQFERYDALVIDLRDNPGGSFPGMLRALSPFRCRHPEIGRIFRASRPGLKKRVDLLDNLEAQSQLDQLDEAENVRLKAFPGYGCFAGPVTVLIDAGTSSVAEIFAQAMSVRPRTTIAGQPSAGEVVMAKWIPMPSLGSDDYSVSIPIAGYMTTTGETLEDRGVHPAVYLDYDLVRSLQGRDTWVEDAAALLRRQP